MGIKGHYSGWVCRNLDSLGLATSFCLPIIENAAVGDRGGRV